MEIAIIGGGISGLTAAYRLGKSHRVTVFEANEYIGGHTNTVDVLSGGTKWAIDTGFIVFNDATYPEFTRLLGEWGVASQPTTMSFSVRCQRTGLEYRGVDWNGLFAQRRNLFNWRFYRLLRDFFRFSRQARELLVRSADAEETVDEFLQRGGFSAEFRDQYFLPMGSAVWSCPRQTFGRFPVRFVAEFYHNHGMLSAWKRPQWRVIQGGSREYVRRAVAMTNAHWRTASPVHSVRRLPDGVSIESRHGRELFDHVLFACHSDQALRLLGDDATPTERELLSAFPYERNVATLHTDASLLPRSKRAWACWNYLAPEDDPGRATVTYNMNLLQGLTAPEAFLVTLNGEDRIDPRRILRQFVYHHPVFTVERERIQQRHAELINCRRTSFCGAYWRNGFHEDGVTSALAVCRTLEQEEADAQLLVRGMGQPSALVSR